MASDLVTLADVHDFLNIPTGDTTHDTKLQHYIDAASDIIRYQVGDVVAAEYTETHDPVVNVDHIMLRHVPVLSIESVVEYVGVTDHILTEQPPGQTKDFYGYSLDIPAAGLLVRRGGSGIRCNFLGDRVVVSYTAGRQGIPDDVFLATLEDIRGLYQQTQTGGRPGFQSGQTSDVWTSGPLNLFPRLAAILDSSKRTQSIA